MTFDELSSRFALAFGLGLLIGLERGWHSREIRPGARTAGVRTFAITGMLGGVIAAMAQTAGRIEVGGGILLGATFLAFSMAMVMFSREENRASGTFSATTAVAAMFTFMLGAYALIGDPRIAAAAAVAVAGLLMIREPLHAWLARITPVELQSGLILLAMTFIALPLLPDRAIGPFGGVNLRTVWLIAIVLATISFAGYVAVKLLGERYGTLVAAAAGGVVSSTAVTFANARRASADGPSRLLAAGVALATAVSFLRVGGIVGVLQPTLAVSVLPSLFAGVVVACGFAVLAARSDPHRTELPPVVHFDNPFDFWSVLVMAITMAVLIVLGHWVQREFGASGVMAGAAAMGLFDVDAMTVSMLKLNAGPHDTRAIANAILIGVAANTFSKVAICGVLGRGPFVRLVAFVCLGCVIAGWLTTALLAYLRP